MSPSPPSEAGRLLPFDPGQRRNKFVAPNPTLDDASVRYEEALDALLDALGEEDVYLLDELDQAVALLLARSHLPRPGAD